MIEKRIKPYLFIFKYSYFLFKTIIYLNVMYLCFTIIMSSLKKKGRFRVSPKKMLDYIQLKLKLIIFLLINNTY